MEYKITIFPRAEIEIVEAFLFYESKQKSLGQKFIEHIDKLVRTIQENPEMFPVKSYHFREVPLDNFLFVNL